MKTVIIGENATSVATDIKERYHVPGISAFETYHDALNFILSSNDNDISVIAAHPQESEEIDLVDFSKTIREQKTGSVTLVVITDKKEINGWYVASTIEDAASFLGWTLKQQGILIFVAGTKGGVGKTTTITSLAHILSHEEVLLIDGDIFDGNISKIAGIEYAGLSAILQDIENGNIDITNLPRLLKQYVSPWKNASENLFVLTANSSDFRERKNSLTKSFAEHVISSALVVYPIVLLDLPSDLTNSLFASVALNYAAKNDNVAVVVVAATGISETASADNTLATLSSLKIKKDKIWMVINGVSGVYAEQFASEIYQIAAKYGLDNKRIYPLPNIKNLIDEAGLKNKPVTAIEDAQSITDKIKRMLSIYYQNFKEYVEEITALSKSILSEMKGG